MKNNFYFLLSLLFAFFIPVLVEASVMEDGSIQTICNGSDVENSVRYALENGEERYLFCKKASSEILKHDKICNDDGKTTTGDKICLDTKTKTITIKNFKGTMINITDFDLNQDGTKDHLTLVYENDNIINATSGMQIAGIYATSDLTIKEANSSSTLVINAEKRMDSNIYRDGMFFYGGNFNITNCSSININLVTTCAEADHAFSGIQSTGGKLLIEKSKITINVKKGSDTCGAEESHQGYGIFGEEGADITVKQEENATDATVNIYSELGGVKVDGKVDLLGLNFIKAKESFDKTDDKTDDKVEEPEKEKYLKGDWNLDGKINTMDVLACRKYLVGDESITLPSEEVYDFDGDKKLSSIDLIDLRKLLVELS